MSALKLSVVSGFLRPFFVTASIAALLTSASVSSAQSQSNNIKVLDSVAGSIANRLGVTLGGAAEVEGAGLLKNLVVNNPGFEPADDRAILRCAAVTTDSCQVGDAATGIPAGFWNGAHYMVMSGRAAGSAGTVVSDTSGGVGSVLALDKSLNLSTGDYLSVELLDSGNGVAGWSSSVAGGGTITAETTDLSQETPGKQAVSLSALSNGASARLSQQIGAQPGHRQLQLNGAYEISFLAKSAGGNNQLNVSVTSGSAPLFNRAVALTDSWAQYTLSFSPSQTGAQGPLQLSFAAAGANIELDDVSLQQSNSSSGNTTAFRDELVNALQESHPGTIRMASAGSDVLTQLVSPFARPSQTLSDDVTAVRGTAYGIQEFLQLAATLGADPWITVPASTTPAEMKDLVQYLTGNGSDSWSALRIARGQAEPWTSAFSKIHIELENGTGISGSASQPMASAAYAVWSNAVLGSARSSSGYSASKIDLVSSGSGASTSWGTSALSASKQQDPAFTSSTLVMQSGTTLNISPVAAVATQADTSASSTPVINYPDGFAGSPSTIWLENFATYSGSSIHLVPSIIHNASNAWYKTTQNVQSFTTSFTFHVVCPAAPTACGDGFGFMIISDPNPTTNTQSGGTDPGFTFSAASGGQFSWSSCATVPALLCPMSGAPTINSVLVKFDLYNVTTSDDTANLTGYYTDGEWPQPPNPEFDMKPSGINMQSGHEFSATLTYNGTTLTETLTDTETGATYTNSYAADIPSTVLGNTAFVGFGGGTGLALDDIYIDSWTYATGVATPTAATPAFSVAAGTYTSAQTVSISDSTAGATIYYTTNGTTPTISSTKYTGATSIGSTETLEAMATASNSSNSAVATAAYTINISNPSGPGSGSGSGGTGGTTSINYPSGQFKASAFSLNGGATVTSSGLLQVTDGGYSEARSAWFASKVPVKAFTTDFTFQQLDATADGMTFTIQGQSHSALGGSGGSLGYAGIAESIAIKFDVYNNEGEGTDSTGLYMNGAQPSMPAFDLSSAGIVLRSGHLMHAHLVYTGTTLTITLTDTVTNATVTAGLPLNIPSLVGGDTAYVGFTGGTGGATATQNVVSWTYSTP